MGKQELPPGYIKNESRDSGTEIGIKTIEQRKEEISWEESGTESVAGFGEKLSVKARRVLVEFPDKHLWQYGINYTDGLVKKGLAIYEDKEKAIKGGIDIAEIEIRTMQQED